MSRWFILLLAFMAAVKATPAIESSEVEGRSVGSMMRDMWNYFFGDDDDDYDYDYAYPNDAYRQDNEVSSYSFYNARTDYQVADDDDDEYSWGEFALDTLLVFTPIALLTLFPPLITVGVKRSLNDDVLDETNPAFDPLLRTLQESDLLSLSHPSCQKKLFCEYAQLGKQDDAGINYKIFYYVSHLIPDRISRKLRMQNLFRRTRANDCSAYSCRRVYSFGEAPLNDIKAPLTKDI